MKSIWLIILLFLLLTSDGSALDVRAIQRAIAEQGAPWQAADNQLTRMSREERIRRLGLIHETPLPDADTPLLTLAVLPNLPTAFDWRNQNGNWLTPVRDQGSCGSCWAFSALAQVEAWWKIQNNRPELDIDLSEQFLLSCSGAGNCEEGGWVSRSLDFVRDTGVPLETSLPYKAKSNIPCSDAAADWQKQAVTIPGWGYITFGEAQVENIKTALLYHPVSASFEVFSDFYAYRSGVYQHVIGQSEGWHAVLIVGWNDAEQSWIVKNSWGDGWGERGYFRIKWGESNFGLSNEFIWDEWSSARISLSASSLTSTLIYGRTDTLSFEISNIGNAPLQFYTLESGADDEADWLTVVNGAGLLTAGAKTTVQVIMDAGRVAPGNYRRRLTWTSNAKSPQNLSLDCSMEVKQPTVDARVLAVKAPEGGFPLLTWSPIAAEIDNFGVEALAAFSVICQITQDQQTVYADTVMVTHLAGATRQTVAFSPFKALKAGETVIDVRVDRAQGDTNAFNDRLTLMTAASNLIDDFEKAPYLWDARGGWGVTTRWNGHVGSGAAHTYNGAFPYADNMDALLTFAPGLELAGVDTLFVTYWTRYVTADDNDRCLVEISGDSLNWRTIDSFSGTQRAWERRGIDLTEFAQHQAKRAWFRFRFVSDDAGGSIGVLIDDVELFTHVIDLHPPVNTRVADHRPNQPGLLANFPNPFNPQTTIVYSLPEAAEIDVRIVNLRGQEVVRLLHGRQEPGEYSAVWNAHGVPSGVYFVVLTVVTDGVHSTYRLKMLLLQ